MQIGHGKTNLKIINEIDNEKKASLKSRTIVSVFVVFFYLLLLLFSFLSDQTPTEWIRNEFLNDLNIKGIFAIIFLVLLYFPFFFSCKEILGLFFEKKEKKHSRSLMVVTSFLFLVPSLLFIFSSYFSNLTGKIGDESFLLDKDFVLISFFAMYLIIFFLSVITICLALVFLRAINKFNFLNCFTLCLLLVFVPLGFLGFNLISLFRGWTAILYIFIAVAGTDVMCYLSGLLFGKHKMAKTISPNKTWEGAIGGSILAITLLLCYAGLLTLDTKELTFVSTINDEQIVVSRSTIAIWNIIQFQTLNTNPSAPAIWIILFFVSLFLVISSILGDLLFSYIKRKFNIKDFGTTLKSHGGFLDRLDSLIIASFSYLCYMLIALGIFSVSKNSEIIFGIPYFE